jgi:hypothetical protein
MRRLPAMQTLLLLVPRYFWGKRLDSHDAEREHARECDALTARNLDVQEIFRWPKEYYKVAQRVLRRMVVVDCSNVETPGLADIFKDLPIRAYRSEDVLWVLAEKRE